MKHALEALSKTESDCGSKAWEREQEAITFLHEAIIEAEKAACDGGTCGLGGYCNECPKTPQRQPQIWQHEGYETLCQELELWKAQAQRQWVGLTDEEIERIVVSARVGEYGIGHTIARAIEAAHGIKENT